VNRNGSIDLEEYNMMINALQINDKLKLLLRRKFEAIDKNRNGSINLREFLNFFLVFPKFNDELVRHANSNAPFLYESSLSKAQWWRLHLYNIVETPHYNVLSKAIFCIDLTLAIIPTVAILVQSARPSYYINWSQNHYLWFISIFFALQ